MSTKEITFDAPSWLHIESLAVKLFRMILKDEFYPDIIAGISRGGLVPARIISDLFLINDQKPTLSVMQIGFYAGVGKTHKEPIIYQDLPGHIHGKSILLIDDVADSGVSLEFALQYLQMKKPSEIRIGTLYYKPWSKIQPKYYVEETTSWIIFPHERYEFMTEQSKKEKLTSTNLKELFISTGIPKASIKAFLELIKED